MTTSDLDTRPLLDDEETESRPMTDAEHVRVFGWGWDDPDAAASE